jgi:hypothetical protein
MDKSINNVIEKNESENEPATTTMTFICTIYKRKNLYKKIRYSIPKKESLQKDKI